MLEIKFLMIKDYLNENTYEEIIECYAKNEILTLYYFICNPGVCFRHLVSSNLNIIILKSQIIFVILIFK
jgi:hypothetical protein